MIVVEEMSDSVVERARALHEDNEVIRKGIVDEFVHRKPKSVSFAIGIGIGDGDG